MIQLIKLQREAEYPENVETKPLTPIEVAIKELDNMRVTDAKSFTSIKDIATILHNLLIYEKQFIRDAVGKGFRAGKEKCIEDTFLKTNNLPDKEQYLNQNHPL